MVVFQRLPPLSVAAAKKLVALGIRELLPSLTVGAAASPTAPPAPLGNVAAAAAAAAAGGAGAGALTLTAEQKQLAQEEERIMKDYSMTVDLLVEAVGCRPRRLLTCLGKFLPMTDEELRCRAMTRTQLAELAAAGGTLSPEARAWIEKAKGMDDAELAAAAAGVHMPGA